MNPLLPRIHSVLSRCVRRASKHLYQSVRWRALARPQVLFVVGCQHSGATLMSNLFDADRDCRVFEEFSVLSSRAKAGVRLIPLPDVAAIIGRVRAPLVVVKPLVETQRVRTLLSYFSGARALFLYRHYADVASSQLTEFGAGSAIENIRSIAAGARHNWRSTAASAAVRECISQLYSESMNPQDAAALFWWARTRLYYDLELGARTDVMLCRYEHLTTDPAAVMHRIYAFVGLQCPDLSHSAQVHSATSKGRDLQLSAPVRSLCEQLQARLDAQYEWQLPAHTVPAVIADTPVAQLQSALQ
jgi:hypothetical protein